MTRYCNIGKIVAAHGVKGHVLLEHSLGSKGKLKDIKVFFLEVKPEEFLPYFVESLTARLERELLVKFEGVESKEAARIILKKQVWLPEDDFHKYAAATAPIGLLGFQIIDQGQTIGEILEVIEQPHQILCKVLWKGKDALIPLHEDFLDKIDQKKKLVYVNLPEGLMDIYL